MSKEERHFRLLGLEFPVHQALLIKFTFFIWTVLLIILAISIYFFQYEMTNADLPCGAIAGFLLAYLVTILLK